MKIAVIGGGWAGLAAAVRAVEQGHEVSVFEMAAQWGGRARRVAQEGADLDNGQHILIGAYRATLDLMRTVGVDTAATLYRSPLELRYPDGRGLRMPKGPAWLGFGLAVMTCVGWSMRDRLSLLTSASRWATSGFRCAPDLTVEQLCRGLRPAVRELLIDPLCVAALNTPAQQASASVLLRVLRDALFGGAGAADLLLPKCSLSHLLPDPAAQWLARQGAQLQLGHRVQTLSPHARGWSVDGVQFDAVVLACTAAEASRLAQTIAPQWASRAQALTYEPIVTVYLRAENARLPAPMTALVEGDQAPAQFAFDHGAMGASPGVFAFVVSGARVWVERGLDKTARAVVEQARQCLLVLHPARQEHGAGFWEGEPQLVKILAEKRATFRCVPGMVRPQQRIASRLMAAGDYVQGPYPATLEGAVRSGQAAVDQLAAA